MIYFVGKNKIKPAHIAPCAPFPPRAHPALSICTHLDAPRTSVQTRIPAATRPATEPFPVSELTRCEKVAATPAAILPCTDAAARATHPSSALLQSRVPRTSPPRDPPLA